ncbi:MAG: hypothetical protein Q9162_002690 [Coniocarpon cinnabarinum]
MTVQNPNSMMPNNPMAPNMAGMNRNPPGQRVPSQVQMPPNMPGLMGPNGMPGANANNVNMNMFMRQPGQPNQTVPQTMQHQGQANGIGNQPQLSAANFQQLVLQIRTQVEQNGNASQIRDSLRQKATPATLQNWQNQGIDPLNIYAQNLARQRLERHSQAGASVGPSGVAINGGQNQPNGQPGMGAQPSGDIGKPSIDFARVFNQRAAAERSQASGDLVVPASNNQNYQGQLGRGVFPSQAFAANGNNTNTQVAGQMPGNIPHSRPQSSFQPGQMPGQGLNQPNPNFNSTSPAQNQFVPGQPNALTGQPGGLHMPGPSPAMPTLNQPMGIAGQNTPQRPNPNLARSQQPSPRSGGPVSQTPNNAQNGAPNRGPPADLNTPQGKQWITQQMSRVPENQKAAFMQYIKATLIQQQQQQRQTVPAPSDQGSTQHQRPMGQPGAGLGPQTMPPHSTPLTSGPAPQATMTAPPATSGFPAQNLQNAMTGQNAQRMELMLNAMQLPKDAIGRTVPELDIPMGINNWGGLFDFLDKQPNALSVESQKNLRSIRMRQAQVLSAQRNRQPAVGAPGNAMLGPSPNRAPFINIPQGKGPQIQELIRGNILETSNMREARLKDVSPQELQVFRQRHSQGKDAEGRAPDAQVRGFIMKSKAERVAAQLGSQEFARNLLLSFSRSNSVPIPNAAQNSSIQRHPQPPGPFAHGSMPTIPNQSMPAVGAPLPGSQQRPTTQAAPNGVPPAGAMGLAQQHGPSRIQEEAKKSAMQPTQSQKPGQNQQQEFKGDWSKVSPDQKSQRFIALSREASRMPRGPPQPLPPGEQGATLVKVVKQSVDSLNLVMTALKAYYLTTGDEKQTREVLATVFFFRNQTKPNSGSDAQVEITASGEALKAHLQKLHKFRVFARDFQTKQREGAGPTNNEQTTGRTSQAGALATQQAPSQPPSQNSTKQNLGQVPKAQQIQQDKGVAPQGPPQGPPGHPQPDGSVQYFNEASQLNLAIPPSKFKQRASQPPPSEPPLTGAVKAEVSQKQPSMPESRPAPLEHPNKCSIPGCDYEIVGFATQAEQQEHERTVHKFTGDPLRWCLGSLKDALGLNKPAALRQAAAARAQANNASLRPGLPQSVAMKRETSAQSGLSQGRPSAAMPGVESRPNSAAGNKRSASSLHGQYEADAGSPSKRPRTAPPRIDAWQHTQWSRELMTNVFGDIPMTTVPDTFVGCTALGFGANDVTPDELEEEKMDEQEGDEDKEMSDVDHIQSLIDWQDPHTEALFNEMDPGGDATDRLSGDWFLVDGAAKPEPAMEVSDEQIEEFLKGESTADLEQAFVEVDQT